MIAPDAPVEKTIALSELSGGFFRVEGEAEGKIFYGCDVQDGAGVVFYSTNHDGTISRCPARKNIGPDQAIEVINRFDLGIAKIFWAAP